MTYCLPVWPILGSALSPYRVVLGPAGAPALWDLHSAYALVVGRFVTCYFWHKDNWAETHHPVGKNLKALTINNTFYEKSWEALCQYLTRVEKRCYYLVIAYSKLHGLHVYIIKLSHRRSDWKEPQTSFSAVGFTLPRVWVLGKWAGKKA